MVSGHSKFSQKYFCIALAIKCSLFSTIKERRLYSWKNFHGTEKHESLAQRIFSRLRYGVQVYRSILTFLTHLAVPFVSLVFSYMAIKTMETFTAKMAMMY